MTWTMMRGMLATEILGDKGSDKFTCFITDVKFIFCTFFSLEFL
jgi:hypothetical protein